MTLLNVAVRAAGIDPKTQSGAASGTSSAVVPAPAAPSAGHVIVDSLLAHGVRRVYVVPGESYLEVLDGLHASPIETIDTPLALVL